MEHPQVVILAGGLGTRLRPAIGPGLPKALAPLAGRPFLAQVVESFAQAGAHDVLLLTGWCSAQIEDALGDGAALGVRATYSTEPAPLGTGGALLWAHANGRLAERFVLTNGDTVLEEDHGELLCAHAHENREHHAAATLAGIRMSNLSAFGSLEVEPWPAGASGRDAAVRLLAFGEKSVSGPGVAYAGVAVMERFLFDPPYMPADFLDKPHQVSLEKHLVPAWLQGGLQLSVWVSRLGFTDIGTPESYEALRRSREARP